MNSMMKRGTLSSIITTHEDDDESPEESSWTMYLQDFLLTNNHGDDDDDENTCFSSYGSQNYPFISDAASSVAGNISSRQVLGFGIDGNCNNRISKQALLNDDDDDDALEDTATSPIHSPKVCNQSHSDVKPTLQKDVKHISYTEKGRSSGLADDEMRNELGFTGRESNCTELKKRGLCLVPFSMVANYFG